jgi:hypothetical protein
MLDTFVEGTKYSWLREKKPVSATGILFNSGTITNGSSACDIKQAIRNFI